MNQVDIRTGRRRARLLARLLLTALIATTAVLVPTDPASAATEQFTGTVDRHQNRRDAWFFDVTAAGTISASLDWDDPDANLSLFLKDPSGTMVAAAFSPNNRPEQLTYEATVTGRYKLEVKAKRGSANYVLDVVHSDTGQPPGNSYNFSGNATSWTAHTFEVTKPSNIDAILDWTNTSVSVNLYLKDPTGMIVARSLSGSSPRSLSHFTTVTGTWLVAAKPKSGSSDYSIDVTVTGGGGTGIDPLLFNRTIGSAGGAEINPSGLDVDDGGTVYVADTGNDRISAYDATGQLLWIQGDRGPKQMGRFDNPRDVAYLDGKVYVADTGYKRIQVLDATDGTPLFIFPDEVKSPMGVTAGVDALGNDVILVAQGVDSRIEIYEPNGALVSMVGSNGSGNGEFIRSRDAATDSAGNIYVVDYGNHRVVKFAADGTWLMNWGSLGSAIGQFRRPYGIAVDDQDNVYVADNGNERIHKFDTAGNFVANYAGPGNGPGEFHRLRRVAVGAGSAPQVYGAGLWSFKIERFAQDGTHERTFGAVPPPPGLLNEPYGIAVTDSSTFIMDATGQRVQRFGTVSGAFELTWGARGDDADNYLGFDWPHDLTIDDAGNVWVADTRNSRVVRYDADGIPAGYALGTRGNGDGELNWPYALDAAGTDLVIADTLNDRVERWQVDGPEPVVVWSVDGFGAPRDLAVSGNSVWVADSNNKRVVELDLSDGSFLQDFGASELHTIEGIAVEPNGDVWVSDSSDNRLVEYSSSGMFLQEMGSLGSGIGQFNRPTHLEFLEAGNLVYLFVADTWNGRIEVYEVGDD